MSKMKELSMILDEMIAAGNALVKTASALKEFYSAPDGDATKAKPEPAPAEKPAKEEAPAEKTYTYEEVRKICATMSAKDEGAYKREVLSLVKKYSDGRTLSKVDPSQYAALVAEVEVLGNAG